MNTIHTCKLRDRTDRQTDRQNRQTEQIEQPARQAARQARSLRAPTPAARVFWPCLLVPCWRTCLRSWPTSAHGPLSLIYGTWPTARLNSDGVDDLYSSPLQNDCSQILEWVLLACNVRCFSLVTPCKGYYSFSFSANIIVGRLPGTGHSPWGAWSEGLAFPLMIHTDMSTQRHDHTHTRTRIRARARAQRVGVGESSLDVFRYSGLSWTDLTSLSVVHPKGRLDMKLLGIFWQTKSAKHRMKSRQVTQTKQSMQELLRFRKDQSITVNLSLTDLCPQGFSQFLLNYRPIPIVLL